MVSMQSFSDSLIIFVEHLIRLSSSSLRGPVQLARSANAVTESDVVETFLIKEKLKIKRL